MHFTGVIDRCLLPVVLILLVLLPGCTSPDIIISSVSTLPPTVTPLVIIASSPNPPTPTARSTAKAKATQVAATPTPESTPTPAYSPTPDQRMLTGEESAKVKEELQALLIQNPPFNSTDGIWTLTGYSSGVIDTFSVPMGDQTLAVDVLWIHFLDVKTKQLVLLPVPLGYTIPAGAEQGKYYGLNGRWPEFPNWLYVDGVGRDTYLVNANEGEYAVSRGKIVNLVSLANWLYNETGDVDWAQCNLQTNRMHVPTSPCEIGRALDLAFPGANRAFLRAEFDQLPTGWLPWGFYLKAK